VYAVYCSVLQFVAVCCSVYAVCCSVLQCVAVCCSVLQCVAVCCSVLQCVAVRSTMQQNTDIAFNAATVLGGSGICMCVTYMHAYRGVRVCVPAYARTPMCCCGDIEFVNHPFI